MSIPDIILTVGSIVLIFALLPSIFSKDKPALMTSLVVSPVLFAFAGVYASLELWFSAIATAITASLWLVLAVQKVSQKSQRKKSRK